MAYELNISVSDEGLKRIYDGHKSVTLVKHSPPVDGLWFGPPVAWLAFQPLQMNRITLVENYYIYATAAEIRAGAVININSRTPEPVQPGWTYTFAQGHFAVSTEGTTGAYTVNNQMPSDNFKFGLAQQAVVNNVSVLAPLNAVPLLYNEAFAFIPQEDISIFLSGCAGNGTALSLIPPTVMPITVGGARAAVEVGFDGGTNSFYLI